MIVVISVDLVKVVVEVKVIRKKFLVAIKIVDDQDQDQIIGHRNILAIIDLHDHDHAIDDVTRDHVLVLVHLVDIVVRVLAHRVRHHVVIIDIDTNHDLQNVPRNIRKMETANRSRIDNRARLRTQLRRLQQRMSIKIKAVMLKMTRRQQEFWKILSEA